MTRLPVYMQNWTVPSEPPLEGAGFCAPRPVGTTFGVFPTLQGAGAPEPLAYFPLTGGSYDSLTIPALQGGSVGQQPVQWVNDAMFGVVPVCNRVRRI